MILDYAGILAAALGGVFVSLYIHWKKGGNGKMYCLPGDACEEVVTSQYSKLLGIPNEIYGLFYYGFVFVGFSALSMPSLNALINGLVPQLNSLLTLSTGFAAGFSIYLVFIQARILRKWCTWCTISAVVSLAIFLLVWI